MFNQKEKALKISLLVNKTKIDFLKIVCLWCYFRAGITEIGTCWFYPLFVAFDFARAIRIVTKCISTENINNFEIHKIK